MTGQPGRCRTARRTSLWDTHSQNSTYKPNVIEHFTGQGEMSLEHHTNLPQSFWTWHLKPLPSCFLLQCEQHVLFFQQNIPGIQWGSELISVHALWGTECVLDSAYQSLCRSVLLLVLSCRAVHGAPTTLRQTQWVWTAVIKPWKLIFSPYSHVMMMFYLTSQWSLPSSQGGQRTHPVLFCQWLCAGLDTDPQGLWECTKTE